MAKRLVVLGEGGHASAVCNLLDDFYQTSNNDDVGPDDLVLIGVGDIKTRKKLFEKFKGRVCGIHDADRLIEDIGEGVQFMYEAYADPSCTIGANVLLNTRCQVDHDCLIGPHCVIGPGAILCGNVKLGEACFIGAGAIIIQGVELDEGTFVPAGTLVVGPDDMRRPQRVLYDGTFPSDMEKRIFDLLLSAG